MRSPRKMKISYKSPCIDLQSHFILLTNIGYNLGRVLLQILHTQMGRRGPYLYKKERKIGLKTLNQDLASERHTRAIE